MNILIMGAGALGIAVGGFLAKDHTVTLIGREKNMKPIEENGLKITGILGDYHIKNLVPKTDVKDVPKQDLVLVATKSQDTEEAAKQLQNVVSEETIVVSLQNGLGNEEILEKVLGKSVLGAIVIMGFEVTTPGTVHVGVIGGDSRVGEMCEELSERAEQVAGIFNSVGLKTHAVQNIKHFLWTKFMYNCCLNSLGAIFEVEYGKLSEEHSWTIVKEIIREAFLVAKAEGISLEYKSTEEYEQFLKDTLPKITSHRASMLQDLELGRKTEIDFLNGKIVELGKKHGIKTPVNELITNLIKFKENNH